MDYRKRSQRTESSYYSRNRGVEAAKQHIREAAELSRELGGTDADVKAYFFGLTGAPLKTLLDDYGQQYGQDKRQYAEEALPHWKSGKRQMSGLVAGRLFSLLPRHMPVKKKFELVESLWRFCGRGSYRKLYVGPVARADELTSIIQAHLRKTVDSYTIDDSISARFSWLADDDSLLCQELRNHFLVLEREQLGGLSQDRISAVLAQIRDDRIAHQTITQTFEVGKHKIEVQFSPLTEGISEHPPSSLRARRPSSAPSAVDSTSGESYGWIWIAIFIFFVVLLVVAS